MYHVRFCASVDPAGHWREKGCGGAAYQASISSKKYSNSRTAALFSACKRLPLCVQGGSSGRQLPFVGIVAGIQSIQLLIHLNLIYQLYLPEGTNSCVNLILNVSAFYIWHYQILRLVG